MALGCGNAKSLSFDGGGDAITDRTADVASDRAVGDGGTCKGEAMYCAFGGPSGTGVACGGLLSLGTCVAGAWTCPKGMVDSRECTCGEFGLGCVRQVCTESGLVCVDAGVDGDAVRDGGECRGDLAEIGAWCPATFDGAPENVPACMAFGLQQVWTCGDVIALGLGRGVYLVDCYYGASSHVLVGAMAVNDTNTLCGNSFAQSAGDVPTEACRFPGAMPSLYRWCSGADSGAD